MSATVIIYRGHKLVARPQPGGGYMVDVAPVGGGKTFATEHKADLESAMNAARRLLDSRFGA